MSTPVCFEALSDDWITSAWRLSSQAGWNQTEEDWRRLCRLDPQGVGIWRDGGEVRAAYSVVVYPPGVAWIGMILVDRDYRGSGLGKAAFEAALERCNTLGCTLIGLDATDLGEPIYLKYNFQSVEPIARWGGTLGLVDEPAEGQIELLHEVTPDLLELDRHLTGVDRSLLLKDLLRSGGSLLVVRESQAPVAYGVLREGRNAAHLGPVIAGNRQHLRQILAAASSLLKGRELVCDAFSQPEAEEELRAAGLLPLRHLKRMTFPHPSRIFVHSNVICAAGFELG